MKSRLVSIRIRWTVASLMFGTETEDVDVRDQLAEGKHFRDRIAIY